MLNKILLNASAFFLSSSDKYLFLELKAKPLSSLIIGQGIISIGMFKSLTIFLRIINCCLSFSPKNA